MVDRDAEARHDRGLDVAHELLGRFGRERENVDFLDDAVGEATTRAALISATWARASSISSTLTRETLWSTGRSLLRRLLLRL